MVRGDRARDPDCPDSERTEAFIDSLLAPAMSGMEARRPLRRRGRAAAAGDAVQDQLPAHPTRPHRPDALRGPWPPAQRIDGDRHAHHRGHPAHPHRAVSTGGEAVRRDLQATADAQQQIGTAAEAAATVTETAARRQLSAASSTSASGNRSTKRLARPRPTSAR